MIKILKKKLCLLEIFLTASANPIVLRNIPPKFITTTGISGFLRTIFNYY